MANSNSSDRSESKSSLPARKPTDLEVAELISQLTQLWTPHEDDGLRVRHSTGCRINDLIGPPSKRLRYGDGVLNQVADQIHVSRSELSRMRKLAEVYSDLDAFRVSHPKCNTWSQVKAHLATLVPTGSPKAVAPPAGRLTAICRSISVFAKKIKALGPLSPTEKTEFKAALNVLKGAAGGETTRPAHVDLATTSAGSAQSVV